MESAIGGKRSAVDEPDGSGNKMKRHSEDGTSEGSKEKSVKRQRPGSYEEALVAGKYELRLLVSSRGAGGIIGKGGENIKRLRSEYDANIAVPDSQTPERVASITASVENVLSVVREIIKRLDEVENREMSDRGDSELKMLVHQSHAGAVIGKSGIRIREIREDTGARLKVFSDSPPQSTERVVQITGRAENVAACISYMINMLKEIPIKGASRPYESMFYDPSYAIEYGGYPPDKNYRGPVFRNTLSPYPPYGRYGCGRGPMPLAFGGRPETTQVTIPNELGGTVIGKGGERINRVREESGAQIIVGPQQENGERIITITGTPAAIQTAQYLLQQCVRQSVAGRKYLNEI